LYSHEAYCEAQLHKNFKKSKNLLNSQQPAQNRKKPFWLPWSFRG
jgi:hypothetical protein